MSSFKKQLLAFGIMVLLVISPVASVSAQKRVSNSPLFETTELKDAVSEIRIATTKPAYALGETVMFNGAGFNKTEQVTIAIEEIDAFGKTSAPLANWVVFADENGNVSGEWPMSIAGRLVVKATGNETGKETQTIVSAAVTPIVMSGSPSCTTLNNSNNPAFAHINSSWGLRLQNPPTGSHSFTDGGIRTLTGGAPSEPGSSLSITRTSSTTINWSSNREIKAVIVRGGGNANVYPYNPSVFGDQTLNASGQSAISHVEVCYEKAKPADITIIKDAMPDSPQAFNFTASGQVAQSFSLIDNGVFGPDRIQFENLYGFGEGRSVTITESSSAPFSLVRINCTSNGTGTENNLINVPARFTTIVLEEGESVVCTFVNAVTTAAAVSVSGATLTQHGKPLTRTLVTIQNALTGEIRSTYSNNFGRYRFEGLPVGDTYIVTVSNRRYVFEPNTQVFMLIDAIDGLNFSAASQ